MVFPYKHCSAEIEAANAKNRKALNQNVSRQPCGTPVKLRGKGQRTGRPASVQDRDCASVPQRAAGRRQTCRAKSDRAGPKVTDWNSTCQSRFGIQARHCSRRSNLAFLRTKLVTHTKQIEFAFGSRCTDQLGFKQSYAISYLCASADRRSLIQPRPRIFNSHHPCGVE